ncbi:urease accessory protein [Zymomonas mobilis]|uniref:Urease accessory protein UreD n=1 Tax=Zymomonas mobilis TaxID=542 RepID=A0A542W2J3_ZYMMB|nr:urease accessory protein UreD [Zymomonas mobilis]TQL17800.1 urease accessory protein [Zymomonas mobilis]
MVNNGTNTLQRALGKFALEVQASTKASRLASLRQEGCCRLLFPYPKDHILEAVTVNISGGIAAGDQIEGFLQCHPNAHLLVTSQAAERIYKARSTDKAATVNTECKIAENAILEWLPHSSIFFDGSKIQRKFAVDMADSSEFLFLESRIFGRQAFNESASHISFYDRLSIRRGNKLIMEDIIQLDTINRRLLSLKAVSQGRPVLSTLVWVSPLAEEKLAELRPLLPNDHNSEFAASAWNHMLVIRSLSSNGRENEKQWRRLLHFIRHNRSEPSTWRF